MKIELAPSILSSNFAQLGSDVLQAIEGGGTILHVDVMDGHFVPNITLGPPVVKSLRKVVKVPLDCHLMIENPDLFIPEFAAAGSGLDFSPPGGYCAPGPTLHPDFFAWVQAGCGDKSGYAGGDVDGGAGPGASRAGDEREPGIWRAEIYSERV